MQQLIEYMHVLFISFQAWNGAQLQHLEDTRKKVTSVRDCLS